MIDIVVENVNSRVATTDSEVIRTLHEKLRFRPKNYFHNPAYQNKRWDGWKEFFDKKTGGFSTGLLPEVVHVCKALKKEYKLTDARERLNWLHNSVDQGFLNQSLPEGFDEIKLHDYQPDFVNKCIRYGRGIVQSPTGSGKTFVLVSLLKCLPPKTPVLFLTKNASLVHQNWEEMKKWGVENLGRWYSKHHEVNYVTCATVHEKTFESLKNYLPKFKVLLVDEVHDCVSDTPVRAYKKMKAATTRIGFSATPFKWDKKKIDLVHKYTVKSHFGSVFKTDTTETGFITTKDLQDRGILSPSDCVFYIIDKPDLKYEPWQDAVKLGIEQNFYFHDVIKRLTDRLTGRTVIIVERIEEGEYLHQLHKGSFWIQGNDSLKARMPAIQAMKTGEKSIVIAMKQLITAGIDAKVHNLINASGGEACHNLIQQIGRGLRNAKDKTSLQYYDFMFMINKHLQKHSEWRAEVLKKEKHNVVVKAIDF